MLVLSRKKEQRVIIDGRYEVRVVEIRGDKVRLGFTFPRDVTVHRGEVQDAIDAQQVGRAGVVACGDGRREQVKTRVIE